MRRYEKLNPKKKKKIYNVRNKTCTRHKEVAFSRHIYYSASLFLFSSSLLSLTMRSCLCGDPALVDIKEQQSRCRIGQVKVPHVFEGRLILVVGEGIYCRQAVHDAQAVLQQHSLLVAIFTWIWNEEGKETNENSNLSSQSFDKIIRNKHTP